MNNKQATLGIFVIITGVLILLANLDIGPIRAVLEDWWPLAIVAVGAFGLWSNPRQYLWPLLAAAFGGLALLETLDIADVDLGAVFFPLLVVGVGVALLSGSRGLPMQHSEKSDEDITAIMAGSTSRNNSSDYKGAAVTVVMGGVELDLSKAVIKDQAVLKVSALMGGVEVRVAEDVIVKNRAQMIMGGIEDKTLPVQSKNPPILYIDGMIVMAGLEVKR